MNSWKHESCYFPSISFMKLSDVRLELSAWVKTMPPAWVKTMPPFTLEAHHFENFVKDRRGAARTQAPTSTNYDVHSPTWGDVRLTRCRSAMRTANLGHGLSWSPIDPVQVSKFLCPVACCFIIHPSTPLSISFRCGAKISRSSRHQRVKTVSGFSKEFICLEEAVCFELGWIHDGILGTFERKLRSCILDLVSSFFGFW